VATPENDQREVHQELTVHMGAGVKEHERPHVLETLSALAPHLGRWDAHDVGVEVSVQDRDGKEQRVTLRTTLPGFPPLIAVADDPHLTRALSEAKRELIRQIEHQKTAREPKNNRQLRSKTIRQPGAPATDIA
jgi:ribosome-associated translation inhibitor RaiA